MTDDIRQNVAENITELRLMNGLTQLQLAEKINYSDKAVSKWERGEAVPDITVLATLAELFGVTVDDLIKKGGATEPAPVQKKKAGVSRAAICGIAVGAVWCVAVFAFILTSLISSVATFQWLYFAYALPVSLVVLLVLNSVWFVKRNNYFIVSGLLWAILVTVYCTFLYFGNRVGLIFLLGVAGQVIVLLCSLIRKPQKPHAENTPKP